VPAFAGTLGPSIVSLKTKAAAPCPPPPPSGLKASDAYAQIIIIIKQKMLMQGI
jgi:hypothetical protein